MAHDDNTITPPGDEPIDEKEYAPVHSESGTDLEKAQTTDAQDAQNIPWTVTRMIAVASLCIVYVGSQVVLYFVSAGLTEIEVSLHTHLGNWMLTANTLAVAAICPFVGYLTDMVGRRWICIFGTICLIVASAVQGTANTLGQAVAAQGVGGIGAGICELTALAGVAEITPARWRGVTLSLVTFSIVPFMPQVLYNIEISKAASWRYCFLLTGLWNVIGMIGLFFCYKPPPRKARQGLTNRQVFQRIDWGGAFLSISGVTLFLVGLQAGGYQFPWRSARVLAPLIVGGLLIIAFCLWEAYGPHAYPMVPPKIFKGQRVVILAYIIVFVAGMDFYSILGFFPIVLEDVYHTSDIMVGVRGLSYPWAILGGACIVSYLMSYTRGQVREMFFFVAAIMTAFTGALALTTPYNPKYGVTMGTFAAFGNGALVVPALTLALFAAPDEYIGTVGALSLSVRFLGGSIGTAIYFNIFNDKIAGYLPALVGAAAVDAGASENTATMLVESYGGVITTSPADVPGVTTAILNAAQIASQEAYAMSLRYVWRTTIPFGVISCICCLFLPNIRRFMTGKVVVDIH